MNNYHIYDEIAKGNHCLIYKSRRKQTIDYYAVKSLEKCRRTKLMNEVKVASALEHENVLRFHNWYETKNHLWVISEYASGGNLFQLLEQDKKFTEDQVRIFAKDLIQGLFYLHSKGVLYCDLKPSKILLNEYGTLKFSDFGLAKRIVDLIQSPEEIKEGSKKGTPSYMSPELFEEDGVFSMQSDIWALGCLIYEMAVGKPPFESDTFQGLVQKVTHEEPIRVNGFTDEFHQLIHSLLDKNPLRRISWSSIFTHPFLRFNSNQIRNLLSFQIPQQTHFERWAASKYSQQHQQILESNKSSKEGSNVLRISLNAKKNFRRELQDEAGFKALEDAKCEGDFILPNRDQNIDIGGYSTQNDPSQRQEVENQNIIIIEQQNQTYGNNQPNYQLLPNSNNSNSKISNYPSVAPAGNTFFSSNKSSQGDSETYLKNYNNIENLNRPQLPSGKQEGGKSQTMLTPSRTDVPQIPSNQIPQTIVLPSSQLQPSLQPQISTQILNSQSQQRLMNSSKFQQTPVYTQRQGSQTPTSPNNLQRTPSNPKYDSNTTNYLATTNFTSRTNNNTTLNTNSNTNSSRQPNHAQTPQTPSSQHAKSVSPYHGSATRSNQKAATLKNIPNTSYGNSIYNSNNNQQTSPYSSNPLNQNSINSSYFHHSHTLSSTNTNLGVSPLRNNSSQKANGTQVTSTSPIGKRGPISLSNNKQIPFVPPQLTDKKPPSIVIESIEKLLVHPSDNQVKPIIGHSDIEKEEETLFKSESLPFTAIFTDEIERNPARPEVDALFGQIFTALHQGNTDKYNILCYFESIIKNSKVANRLLNSAFANFLLEIVQTSKSPQIRLRAVSCIGFLLRFATAIDTQLSSLNLPGVIMVALSTEVDIKVRRKLLATLGEYLFYAATQVDEDPSGSAWRIDSNCLNYLLHLIRNTEEDEIVRFYACKTIENIASQSISVGVYFCTPEGVSALVQVYYSCKTEELKSCVLTGLCHICRQQPMLTSSVIECLGGVLGIVSKIKSFSNSGKTLQSCLTLLNSQLFQLSNQINPASPSWLNQRQISLDNNSNLNSSPTEIIDTVLGISHLLNSGQSVVRGKTILAMVLLIKLDPWCLVAIAQTKFYTQLDKLSKDAQKYVCQAFHHLNSLLQSAFPVLLQQLQSDIGRLSEGQMLMPIPQSVHLQEMLPGSLPFLKVIIQLAGCSQSIIKNLFTDQTLENFFDLFAVVHASLQDSLSQPKDLLMNLSETILSNQSLVIDKLEFFLTVILPKLLDSLSHCMLSARNPNNNSMNSNNNSNSYYHNNSNSIYNSQNNNSSSWKFNCVKLIHDVTVVFAPEWQKWSQQALQSTNELFIHSFIEGILPGLLVTPEEPIKLLVYRIIQVLVETQPMLFVSALRSQNLLSHLLQQLTFTASRSVLRIASKITAASSFQEILSYDLITRAAQLLQHFYSRQQDQCLEDTLDVLIAACSKAIGNNKQNNINSNLPFNFDKPSVIDFPIDQLLQIQHQEALINAYPTCCCIMSSSDPSLVEKSVILLIYLLHFFSSSSRASLSFNTMVLRNDCMSQIINSIISIPSASRNIRVLNWIAQLVAIPKQLRDSISSSLNKLIISSKDPTVIQAIRELMYYLRRE